MSETERERLLGKVDELYTDYGRGPDGMLLPYVRHCYRAVVRPPAVADDEPTDVRDDGGDDGGDDDGDDDALLIDFQ